MRAFDERSGVEYMEDQAKGLRALAGKAHRDNFSEPFKQSNPAHCARVIAVTSGKGGVGKTNFSANLALHLARTGSRVIVLDADLGLANIHVLLGITPRFNMEHVMRGEKRLADIIHPTPWGIRIIGGGSGIEELANLTDIQRHSFIQGLMQLDNLADIILIDTGAGVSRNVLSFVLAADEVIVISTPEPTSIADAYAVMKVVCHENPSARMKLVINMANGEEDAQRASERLCLVTRQFLDVELKYLGYIPQDQMVSRAVRQQKPLLISYPASPAGRSIERIAGQLGYKNESSKGMRHFLSHLADFFIHSDGEM